MTKPLDANIKVKVLSKAHENEWLRQLPNNQPYWGNCHFLFDEDERDYNWLIVYNDLPTSRGERFSINEELLACSSHNTLLITTEPSSIKTYGKAFTAQFGYVLTSQEPWALPHPQRIYSQPSLHWFYGLGKDKKIPFNELLAAKAPQKNKLISTVCSTKQQKHTLHNRRYEFTQELKALMPELDIYGHGVIEMDDKAISLDNYKYHIAIENHLGLHHWTEKLSDAFLGYTLPFYYGCPNAADYFPEDSFIPIDIYDISTAYDCIQKAITDKTYEKKLPAIIEARNRVLHQYNIFAVIHKIVNQHQPVNSNNDVNTTIYSRRALRKHRPLVALEDMTDKLIRPIKKRLYS